MLAFVSKARPSFAVAARSFGTAIPKCFTSTGDQVVVPDHIDLPVYALTGEFLLLLLLLLFSVVVVSCNNRWHTFCINKGQIASKDEWAMHDIDTIGQLAKVFVVARLQSCLMTSDLALNDRQETWPQELSSLLVPGSNLALT